MVKGGGSKNILLGCGKFVFMYLFQRMLNYLYEMQATQQKKTKFPLIIVR